MADERVDVLVIGSGPAGAAVTKQLADRGARVVCLEQGDWVNSADFPSIQPTWETALRRGPFQYNPNVRKRPEDYPVVIDGPLEYVNMFNGEHAENAGARGPGRKASPGSRRRKADPG